MFTGLEKAKPPSPVVVEAQRIWNEFAVKNSWRKCNGLDKARKATILRAVEDYGGIVGWKKALETVERSRFVMGKVAPRPGSGFKQFKANVEWFCQAKTIRQYQDEFYEDDGGQDGVASIRGSGEGARPSESNEEKWKRWLSGYRPRRFWAGSQGPRPEDPGCQCPAGLLAWWREQHGVAVAPTVKESRLDRLQGLVRSYERIGKYADRNRCEEELAKLEGRPAVLIPAPEVAHLSGAGSDRRHTEKIRPLVFDIPPESPAERERERLNEPPAWDYEPEGDGEGAE